MENALTLDRYREFLDFLFDFFKRPDPLADCDCRPVVKADVPKYYERLFVAPTRFDRHHAVLYRRLEPLLSLPPGSRILDYGGGYGVDSVFLARCGYEVVFYELGAEKLAICMFLRKEYERFLEKRGGEVPSMTIIPTEVVNPETVGLVDAILCNETAHHIEPQSAFFQSCASLLRPGGRVFLLEPNWYSVLTQAYFFVRRGFKTVITQVDATGKPFLYGNEHIQPAFKWNALAAAEGLETVGMRWVVPSSDVAKPLAERIPGLRCLLATHVTYDYRLNSRKAARGNRGAARPAPRGN